MVYVIKRNGTVVPFDKDRIIVAINKAFLDETLNELKDQINI